MNAASPQNNFLSLYRAGYRYLVPIVPPGSPVLERSTLARKVNQLGKIPGIRRSDGLWHGFDWVRHECDVHDLARWHAMGAGIGLRFGRQHDDTYVFGLDADTKVESSANIIKAQIEGVFKDPPTRIGMAPKALYLVRCNGPLPYMSLAFNGGVLEVLGQSRQGVLKGIHPGTGKGYYWPRKIEPLADLPIHDPQTIIDLLDKLSGLLPQSGDVFTEGAANRPENQQALVGDPDMLERAIPLIPNVYEAPGRAKFVKMAAAFRGAFQNDYVRGLELFVEWAEKADLSSRLDDKNHEDPTQMYRSVKAPFSVGAGYLYELAETADPTGTFKRNEALAEPWFDGEAAASQPDEPMQELHELPKPAASDVFEMLTPGEIVSRPPPHFVVARYLPERSLGFLYGAPGSRKSFIAFDIAMTLATGMPDWHGHAINADPTACVVYIAGEGSHGMQPRMLAWAKRHGLSEADLAVSRFRLIPVSINMMEPTQVRKLARTIQQGVGRACLVVVDTVSRAMPGADENLQAPMSLFVQQCDAIKDAFGCVVLGVHHANQKGGLRGSGVLTGAGDFVHKLSKEKGSATGVLSCEKMKDGPDGWDETFRFDVVEVEGGSSLVPSRCIVSVGSEASGAPDTEARAQEALQAAWAAGVPWCAGPQGGERYAVLRLINDFGFSRDAAKAAIQTWTLTGRIRRSVFNKSTKAEGYHLTYTPPETEAETPDNGLFS